MSEFKKGEYIVLIGNPIDPITNQKPKDRGIPSSFLINNCYLQRSNSSYIRPEIDSKGLTGNGWVCYKYDMNNWRYASAQEAAEYDRLGKPYNVNELNKDLNYEIY